MADESSPLAGARAGRRRPMSAQRGGQLYCRAADRGDRNRVFRSDRARRRRRARSLHFSWSGSGLFMPMSESLAWRLTSASGSLRQPMQIALVRATLRGGIALELAWLTPVPGWVALLPISIIVGTGAATLSFFRPRIDSQNSSGHGVYLPNTPYTAPYAPPYVPDPYASEAFEPASHGRAARLRPPEPIEVGR